MTQCVCGGTMATVHKYASPVGPLRTLRCPDCGRNSTSVELELLRMPGRNHGAWALKNNQEFLEAAERAAQGLRDAIKGT